MIRSVRQFFVVLVVFTSMNLHAIQEVELQDLADEGRFNELANELRCMVCQNQSIADSNADLARDFRNQVKEKINQGQSNDEIRAFMTDRYGDYILYRPPFNVATALLWTGPFLLIVLGIFMVYRMTRKKPSASDEGNAEDVLVARQEKLRQLMQEDQQEL